MKYINIPVYLNRFIMGATGMLYLTVFLGLYAQILLGGFQLITALILLFFLSKFSEKQKKMLSIYWGIVLAYGLLWMTDTFSNWNDIPIVFVLIIIPLSIAVYFTVILESLKK